MAQVATGVERRGAVRIETGGELAYRLDAKGPSTFDTAGGAQIDLSPPGHRVLGEETFRRSFEVSRLQQRDFGGIS